MVSGWYGGLGPALLATAVAGLTGSYFFMHPIYDFKITLTSTPQALRLLLFLIEGSLIAVLCHTLKSAQRSAEANELEARDLQRQLLDTTDMEQSEEHTSELQSQSNLVCRLLLEKKKKKKKKKKNKKINK